MPSIRALHVTADKARTAYLRAHYDFDGNPSPARELAELTAEFEMNRENFLRRAETGILKNAAEAYLRDPTTEHYDALITVVLACHAIDQEVTP